MPHITVASFNLLNLALPGVQFYENQDPYSQDEYQAKLDWIARQLDVLRCDVVMFQEVFNLQALQQAVAHSTWMRGATLAAPHADTLVEGRLLPRLGIASRLPVRELNSFVELEPADHVPLPGGGAHTRFSRPLLEAVVDAHGQLLRVMTVHLKSKRPEWLDGDDEDNPELLARAQLRSLMMRGGDALGVRQKVIDRLWRTREPLVVLGDFNDVIQAQTTQLIAATTYKRRDAPQRDAMLFDAFDLQRARSIPFVGAQRRDTAYTHAHEGVPETIDHVLVSEEFAPFAKNARGFVDRVDYFNDHLALRKRGEREARIYSDHAQVSATLFLDDESENRDGASPR
ncbi:MAG: endonuclease/exonuclease/phosphatase family protein [Burkholderiaceae bacterium]